MVRVILVGTTLSLFASVGSYAQAGGQLLADQPVDVLEIDYKGGQIGSRYAVVKLGPPYNGNGSCSSDNEVLIGGNVRTDEAFPSGNFIRRGNVADTEQIETARDALL